MRIIIGKKKFGLILIVILLFGVSLGYAFLSTTVNFNGTAVINNAQWDIQLENFKPTDGSVSPTTTPVINDEKTSVTYKVTLTNPGDFYEFTIDAHNYGTINAMISNISITPELTDAQKKYLVYKVTCGDDSEVPEKKLLASTKKETFKVRVEFKKNISSSDLPKDKSTLTLTFSADYIQADSTAITPGTPTPTPTPTPTSAPVE